MSERVHEISSAPTPREDGEEEGTSGLEAQLREMRQRGNLQAAKSEVKTLQSLVSRQEEQLEAMRREISVAQEAGSGVFDPEEEMRLLAEVHGQRQQALVAAERSREEAAAAQAASAVAESRLALARDQREALLRELRLVERELAVATQQAGSRAHGGGYDMSGHAALALLNASAKLSEMQCKVKECNETIAKLLEDADTKARAKAAARSRAALAEAEAQDRRERDEWEQSRQRRSLAFAAAQRDAIAKKERAKKEAARLLQTRRQQAQAYDTKLSNLKRTLARASVKTLYGKDPSAPTTPLRTLCATPPHGGRSQLRGAGLTGSASLPSLTGRRTALVEPGAGASNFSPSTLRLTRSGHLSTLSQGEIAAALLAAAHQQGTPIRSRTETLPAMASIRERMRAHRSSAGRADISSPLSAIAEVPLPPSRYGSRASTPSELREAASHSLPSSCGGSRATSALLDKAAGQQGERTAQPAHSPAHLVSSTNPSRTASASPRLADSTYLAAQPGSRVACRCAPTRISTIDTAYGVMRRSGSKSSHPRVETT